MCTRMGVVSVSANVLESMCWYRCRASRKERRSQLTLVDSFNVSRATLLLGGATLVAGTGAAGVRGTLIGVPFFIPVAVVMLAVITFIILITGVFVRKPGEETLDTLGLELGLGCGVNGTRIESRREIDIDIGLTDRSPD